MDVAQLEEKDIVLRHEGKKIKKIALTERGEKLARLFLEIYPCI